MTITIYNEYHIELDDCYFVWIKIETVVVSMNIKYDCIY